MRSELVEADNSLLFYLSDLCALSAALRQAKAIMQFCVNPQFDWIVMTKMNKLNGKLNGTKSWHWLGGVGLALLLQQAFALTPEELAKCKTITDNSARLACYDALVDGNQTAIKAAQKKQSEATFGLANPNPGQVDEIESRFNGTLEGWDPGQRIKLANGQTWKIVDDSREVRVVVNPKVKIRKGAFGALYMEIEGITRSPRVIRVDQ